MANETRDELVLAQNQYAFLQDETKGVVEVYVGPFKSGLTPNDRPVIFKDGRFQEVALNAAVALNPTVQEGSYVILENPAKGEKKNPVTGKNSPVDLSIGKKVNIPGPTTFSLWPGQTALVVAGHQMRSNEYAIVRVYNADEAAKNWPSDAGTKPTDLAVGDLFIIKGTEVSFFIPPDGLEVVPELGDQKKYVRPALTLESLEYCILLDEDGNKRYELGPSVVFPKATEKFVTKRRGGENSPITAIFKAVELNDQMGLYIKVIADYTENGREFKAGEELFITGKDRRIYYPRPEHAIIEYASEDSTFNRQRYYAIAIPKGEARYVLNKDTGEVQKVVGPRTFLPDPRTQVIVRRVLDQKKVNLWYPGNEIAKEYNKSLEEAASVLSASNVASAGAFVADTQYRAAMDLGRSVNRQTKGSLTASSTPMNLQSDVLKRGTTFTPPPMLTLNTKYDGVPTINVWMGYAVQVVDKSGNRRVVKGPETLLLEYDEALAVLELSTGKPKTTDNLYKTVYLRTDHNVVTDIVSIETKDMVQAALKVSYKVNFEGDKEKWFAVENYIKYLCDHMRSLLRAAAKKLMVKELLDNSASFVRDTVLGPHMEGKERDGHAFKENGMRVYDVEVLQLEIADVSIASLIQGEQKKTVQNSLTLSSKKSELETVKEQTEIEKQLVDLKVESQMKSLEAKRVVAEAEARVILAEIMASLERESTELDAKQEMEVQRTAIADAELGRRTKVDAQIVAVEKEMTALFVQKFGAIDQKLANAIQLLAENGMMTNLANAIAPLAVMEQQGVTHVLDRLFKGTILEDRLNGAFKKDTVEKK